MVGESSSGSPTTIVLVDDHAVVREGLKLLLATEPGFAVIGEAGDGHAAVRLVEARLPDILVLDLLLPGLSGIDVAHEVSRQAPSTRIVVLSMSSSEAHVLEALRNGARAYVAKADAASELIWAIKEAAAGRYCVSSTISEEPVEALLRRANEAPPDPYATLTHREREVLHLAADGLTTPEVGEALCISPRTAETHRARVMHKLGLRSQTDLVRFAVRRGLIPIDDDRPSDVRRTKRPDRN